MMNYMKCNQMMFGPARLYCITYKTNQLSFDVYRRKYWHDFRVPIVHDNLEGSICVECPDMQSFFVSKVD